MTSEPLGRALVEEATKKSGLIWVQSTGPIERAGRTRPAAPAGSTGLVRGLSGSAVLAGSARSAVPAGSAVPARSAGSAVSHGPPRPLWHVWHDGAVLLVGDGPGEQPLPGLVDGGLATVTVRSKHKGGRLVAWTAYVTELAPGSAAWQAAVAELKGKRLNAPDAPALTERWARECRVLRLEPGSARTDFPAGSCASAPLVTPATTRRPIPEALPRLLLRLLRRAR